MKKEEQLKLFKKYCKKKEIPFELQEKMLDIISKKQKDYSKKTDVLSSFKEASDYSGGYFSPSDICASLICVKIARINNLEGRKAVFESLEDSKIDFEIYNFLLFCLENEKIDTFVPKTKVKQLN